jgi:hypothetical protein
MHLDPSTHLVALLGLHVPCKDGPTISQIWGGFSGIAKVKQLFVSSWRKDRLRVVHNN